MSRIVVIFGLCNCFTLKYPFYDGVNKIYTLHEKQIFINEKLPNKQLNRYYTNISVFERSPKLLSLTNDTKESLEANYSKMMFSPVYHDLVFSFIIYVLCSYFKTPYFLDLSVLALKLMNSYTFSKDNYEVVMKQLLSIIKSYLRPSDKVIYSISTRGESAYNVLSSNLKILSSVEDIVSASNIYLGGEFFWENYKNYVHYFNKYHVFVGKDITKFTWDADYINASFNYSFKDLRDINISNLDTSIYETNPYNILQNKQIKTAMYYIANEIQCNGSCAFCCNSRTSDSELSPISSDMTSSLKSFKDLYDEGFNSFVIIDPHLTIPRIFDIFVEFILKHNLKVNIFCGARVKDLNKENVKTLWEIGVKAVNLGIETLNNDHLKFIQKYITVEQISEALLLLHKHNIFSNVNFITNMPYCDDHEIERIFNWIDSFEDGVINGIVMNDFLLNTCAFKKDPNKFKIKLNSLFPVVYEEKNRNISHQFLRQKHMGYEFIKYRDKIFSFETKITLVFALYEKYKDKRIVWRELKRIMNNDGFNL